MKKFIVLLFSLLVSSMVFAQKKQYKIGVLLDKSTAKTDSLLVLLQDEITAIVGEDATLDFSENTILANDYDLAKASQQYDSFLNGNVDIILAFGIVNHTVLSKKESFPKPVILFGGINRDMGLVDFTAKTSNIENFTYLVEQESYEKDLKHFKDLADFTKLGVFIESQYLDVLPLQETFASIMAPLNADFNIIPFTKASDISNHLSEIDAAYLIGGFTFSPSEIENLAKGFKDAKIPSFTVNGVDFVEKGFMATNLPDNSVNQFIRRLALTVEKYINGVPLAEMPVHIEYEPRLTINYNTAEATGIPIKYSLINDTDFIGQFDNVLAEKQYNLKEAIYKALDSNLVLQTSKKEVQLFEQDTKTAKTSYLPSLMASAGATHVDPDLAAISFGQSPEFQTAGTIALEQVLFSESANANISIQKELTKAQKERFNAEKLNTVFNVSNAYFTVLILKANAAVQLRNLDETKKNFQMAQQNYEAGLTGKSDVLRLRSQLAQNTQTLVEATNQLEQGFIALNQLMNNPADAKIDIEKVELDKGIFSEYRYEEIFGLLDEPKTRNVFVDFLVEEARKNAPELKELGYTLNATERNIKLNGAGRFLPTVGLQGNYNSVFNRSGAGSVGQGFTLPDNTYNVGVQMTLPIFNRNRTNLNKQRALIEKEQLTLIKENSELNIEVNVRNSVLNLINEIANIELSKVAEVTAEEALTLTQASYTKGAANVVQLLDAQNNLVNAQLAKSTAIYKYLANAIQVERLIGYYFLLNTEEENNSFTKRFLAYQNNNN